MKCTGRNCPMQIGTVDPAHCLADECPYVTKPLTNADCIRAMTDEEMAVYLFHKVQDIFDHRFFCCSDMLEWLKQEVTIEYDKIDEPFKGKFIKSWRVGEPLREEDFLEEKDD